jgi:hypothetical protein
MSTPEGRLPSPEGLEPDSLHTNETQDLPAGSNAQAIPDDTMAHPITWEYLEALERETPEEREAKAKAARARREAEADRELRARAEQRKFANRPDWVPQAIADGTMARPLTEFDFDDEGRVIYPDKDSETVDLPSEQHPNQP